MFKSALSWVMFAALAIPAGDAAAATFSSKSIAKCQKTINKDVQKLTKAKLGASLACAEAMLACQLGEELDAEDFTACAAKAEPSCEARIAKADAAGQKLLADLTDKCADLETKGTAELNILSRRGLGATDAADACAALTTPINGPDMGDLAACLQRAALCRGDDAVEALAPRAYEVLDRAGILAGSPSAFPCLDVRPDSPAAPGSSSGDLVACQKVIDKAASKNAKTAQKGLYSCADGLLGCQLGVDRLEDTSAEGIACQEKVEVKCDSSIAKVNAAAAAVGTSVAGGCTVTVAQALAGLGFSATCPAAASIADVAACARNGSEAAVQSLIGTAEPRSCVLLGTAGKLTGFEGTCIPSCPNGVVDAGEACDDGNGDDFDACTSACAAGPTDFQYVSLPSSADPANTPDGTPANAVDPGSTLATQFGSTIFDLNQAIYTRYFANGAGDPDAVLILIPGFAGGSGSLKYLAENLIARAQASGDILLEVWAFDRRTNLLEDDSGATLADVNHDPALALDWYFGAELGLPLSPALTRRAVFHDGVDVAFIANWTSRMFARDIDAVVDAAHAVASNPKVFLGGHSLGTTFTARYAAADFDDGAGVSPGYAKVDGLVLLEGGGDSVAVAPPSADALDLVIAKADGGLYRAVKDHAGRCVDGTPCATICIGGADDGQACDPLGANTCDSPGVCGGKDADCTGVTLPSGALTNKCVPPVEAYTGDNINGPLVLVTPEVHAAGDIVGIQGKLDPHGLNLIATDFGAGRAIDVVPGLGILDILPPASAEASVGFFLDDDFSPVSAFQASLGFSNNGVNLNFLGFVIPQPAAPPDPYRLWLSSDEPMPALALPNNGLAPTAPNDTWGNEKEVSRVDLLFSFLRTEQRNFGDSYFASSGLSTTSGLSGGTFGGGLDTTALSVGRGRPDIENVTQAAGVDVPVIAFGGTNGLTPTTASFEGFAKSIGVCTAPTCNGTVRVVSEPDTVTTVYGGVDGGFEVHLSEGFAHIDVLSAEDDANNNVLSPLLAFLERNTP